MTRIRDYTLIFGFVYFRGNLGVVILFSSEKYNIKINKIVFVDQVGKFQPKQIQSRTYYINSTIQ